MATSCRSSYRDGTTPTVAFEWDRQGRRTRGGDANALFEYHYNAVGLLESEQCVCGLLAGINVTNGYDALLRRTNLTVLNSSFSILHSVAYAYDNASRLKTVSSINSQQSAINSAEYSYLANSPLVEQIRFKNGGMDRMMTTRKYDAVNRLVGISSVSGQTVVASFAYQYNNASQRVAVTNAAGDTWRYGYDSLGQVTSGNKYLSDDSPVAGQQYGYQFDDIGNRKSASVAGGESGLTKRDLGYTANILNQYTGRDVSRWVEQSGTANALSTVTLNDKPTVRQGEYYWGELYAENSAAPAWVGITNLGVLNDGTNPDIVTGYEGHKYVPKTPEAFTHDDDGNLTTDGRWTYTWDAENRLKKMESLSDAPQASKRKLEFAYDYQGRRIQKDVCTNNPSTLTYELSTRTKFAYDGWNLQAILTSDLRPLTSFTWGLDLSGSEQGAGGVGGLLWESEISNSQFVDSHYASYDGNGNVMALVKASDGTESARYEYGPFGELLRATGPMGLVNPFRFSTKYTDDETCLLYYGYRYYTSTSGRWLSRDPIEEAGGMNLYGFVCNNPVNGADDLGLADLRNHMNIGMSAMDRLGIKLGWTQAECFRRGLVMPDMPTVDVFGAASWLGFDPIATQYDFTSDMDYVVAESKNQIKNIKQQIRQNIWILDPIGRVTEFVTKPISRPFNGIAYWWNDNHSFIGDIIRWPFSWTKIVRTHYGDLAYNHAMGDTGMEASLVRRNMVRAMDELLLDFQTKRKSDCCRAYLELGMAVHILTDSWTVGHARRDASGKIDLFQDFRKQSKYYHKREDYLFTAQPISYMMAISQSADLIQKSMGSTRVESFGYFQLSDGARVGVDDGAESAKFFHTIKSGYPNEK
jgi:RHS repeat-associated protein